ncbi:7-cyano-7-deazaguanine synthase QueC [bacterium]|nr:7-cyano-7-deazaguanine synthase QueC [bacterium]
MSKRSSLVILSGGQDSATCLLWAIKEFGDDVHTLTFDYGQKHKIELECAEKLSKRFAKSHRLLPVSSLKDLAKNALTDDSIEIKKDGGFQGLPSTFVPGRNALFLNLAAAYAAPRGMRDLVIGTCETDYSGYPDCRKEFIDSMQKSLSLAMDFDFTIHTPLMFLSKGQTFKLASDLGGLKDVVENTHTCYQGNHKDLHSWGYGCGECPACELRRNGFEDYQRSLK